jgi:thioredoxin
MVKDSIVIRCNKCGAGNRVKAEKLNLQPVCGRCQSTLPPPWTSPVHITDGTFTEEVLESPLPVLVDFWSPRCGPCAALSPVLDGLAAELAGKLKICKLNTDENMTSAARFGITAVPSMLIFRGGLLLETLRGALPRDAIKAQISRFLRN